LDEHFPQWDPFIHARDYVRELDRMIREDQRHASEKRATPLTGDARIQDLIFRLRDAVGYQVTSPGWVEFLYPSPTPEQRQSPAHQLADAGLEAVPQLIAAMDTTALTRSYYYRNGPRSIVSVRECVFEILSSLSGLRLNAITAQGELDLPANKKRITEWWLDVQARGERAVLIDGARAGHEGQAELLVAKFPAEAVTVLGQALERASESDRSGLIRQLSAIKTGEELPLLRAEIRRLDGARLTAAKALADRGNIAETVDPMIEMWSAQLQAEVFETDSLAKFLVSTGAVRAVDALGANWQRREFGMRIAAVDALDFDDLKGEARDHAEAILIAALEDKTVHPLGMMVMDGLINPRVCDVAARSLAHQWKGKYVFDEAASKEVHDQQIAAIKETWRKRGGRP
jgi:hypothetical protein